MPTDFYSIPDFYDILHAPGTAREVSTLRAIRRRFVGKGPGRWLEPACGTGRYLLHAARLRIPAVGFDLQPRMIRYAKARAQRFAADHRPRFLLADMRDFDQGRRLGTFDFAFNPINTIRHLATDAAMLQHFAAVARVLSPRGVYAVGLSLCAFGLEPLTEDFWQGRRGRTSVQQVVQYIPPTGSRGEAARAERVISHLTITRGMRETHIDSSYALRGYNLAQWTTLVARARWSIAGTLDSFGNDITPPEPGYAVFVLRPPTAPPANG